MQIANKTASNAAIPAFDAVWSRVSDYVALRRRYHTTLNELQMLSDRELSDLGMNRAMLRSVAWDAAQAD